MTPAADEIRRPDDTARPYSDADLRAAIHAAPLPPDQRRRPGVALCRHFDDHPAQPAR